MSIYAGTNVLVKTNSGVVPGITTAHYSGASAAVAVAADVTAVAADFADILLLGESNARYYKVARNTVATGFGLTNANTSFTYWVPA